MLELYRRRPPSPPGFTLIELAVTLCIAAVLLCTVVPSLQTVLENRRLHSAVSLLANDVQQARAQAIATNQTVRLRWQRNSAGSCYVLYTGTAHCSCEASGQTSCVAIKTVAHTREEAVHIQANVDTLVFDPEHGTSTPAATFDVKAPSGRSVHYVLNIMGRGRMCSPQARVAAYPAC
jgi:type IV fimbrial biogenesis protein FimT